MPLLFLTAFALTLAALTVLHWFDIAVRAGSAQGVFALIASSPYLRDVVHHLGKIATIIVAVPLIRFSLIGLRRENNARVVFVYLRYAVLWIPLVNSGVVVGFAATRLKYFLAPFDISQPVIVASVRTAGELLFAGFVYIAARSILVFSHVALGGKFEWKAAWCDTSGNFWRIAVVYFLAAVLPMQIVGGGILPGVLVHTTSVAAALFISSFFTLLAIYVGALTIAWIYNMFASEIVVTTIL